MNKLYTRSAHLEKSSIMVEVGDTVVTGQVIAKMGNSGRSEVRHLHFELGTKTDAFDPCEMSQNFTWVHDPAQLDFQ
ncbi:MAG: M23 family metallopeptidase [Bacteroidales bacterium]|nr:M23 family metallopeptidase [Bacteroidales bacterium]